MSGFSHITHPKGIRSAQRQLDARLAREAEQARKRKIGFPGDDVNRKVRYIRRADLWYAPFAHDNRWWNAFGFGDPASSHKALSITVEINPSFTGSRKCAGLFLRDARGRLHLGHTGRVGGGHPGVGKAGFLNDVKDLIVSADEHEAVLIGRIEARNFLTKLADFVQRVQTYKERVKTSAKLPDAATQDDRVPAEDRIRKYPGGESDEHKQLKLHVAAHPEVLGLGPVRRSHVEYAFITGDRVDVMLELANGTHVVVEVELRGERHTRIGAHQAIKYRALMAAERDVQLRQVKAVLVAHELPCKTRDSCQQHGILTKVIPCGAV